MDFKKKKEEKIVFKWTREQEELLAQWSEKAKCYRWLHARSENFIGSVIIHLQYQ